MMRLLGKLRASRTPHHSSPNPAHAAPSEPLQHHATGQEMTSTTELDTLGHAVGNGVAETAPHTNQQEDSSTAVADDESQYISGVKLFSLTAGLVSALFLCSLDSTILATAIPAITNHFNSLNDVAWYAGSYQFASSALQLLYGKLYTYHSIKTVFLVAVGLFELGSLVAGVAPTSDALIVGRTISGLGAAGINAGSLIIINKAVPGRKRALYQSVLGSVHVIAAVVGPVLGGVFTDHVTWRLCFLINLPFGIISIVFLLWCLPQQPPILSVSSWKEQVKLFDLPGTFLLVPCIISLLLGLQWGGSEYPFGDGRIIALFVVAGVLAIAFFGVEIWQKDRATIPMRILNKNILGVVWYGVFLGGASFVLTYYLPIWFQAVEGVSATESGIRTLPSVFGIVLFSIMGGLLATALNQFVPFYIISSVISSVGAGLLSTLKVDSSIGYWFGYQVLTAAGQGIGIATLPVYTQLAVLSTDMAIANTFVLFSSNLANSIFVAIAQAVFQTRLLYALKTQAPGLDPSSVINGGATALRKTVPAEQLLSVLQGYNTAIMQTFYVAVAGSALSTVGPLVMDWLSLKAAEKKEES